MKIDQSVLQYQLIGQFIIRIAGVPITVLLIGLNKLGPALCCFEVLHAHEGKWQTYHRIMKDVI